MSRPSTDLSVEVTSSTGVRTRWDSSARKASNVPQQLQFSTRLQAGFAEGSVVLRRRIDQELIDVSLFDDVAFIGADGSIAYESRVGAMPRSLSDTHTVTLQLAGWIANAMDRTFREIYVDRDLGRWGPATNSRRESLIGTYNVVDPTVLQDADGSQKIKLQPDSKWVSPRRPLAETYYYNDIDLGTIWYSWENSGQASPADTLWDLYVTSSDTADMAGSLAANSGDLWTGGSSGSGYYTVPSASSGVRHAGALMLYGSSPGGDDGYTFSTLWTFAVYGTHDLARAGDDPGGFYASDIMADIVNRFCPKLKWAPSNPRTAYVVPHCVYDTPTKPYDALMDLNKYVLWHLHCWEDKTVYLTEPDLTSYDWQVRISDEGVTMDLQGDSTDDLANGVTVSFDDVVTGSHRTLEPTDYEELNDVSPSNPANSHGVPSYIPFDLSVPTTTDMALQLGRLALAEHNAPKAPGTINVQHHIRDRQGNWQPVWKVRSGQRIAIVDHPDDSPRMIHETNYDHDSRTLTMAVDGARATLDAIIDGLSVALQAANLS